MDMAGLLFRSISSLRSSIWSHEGSMAAQGEC